jgi:hypothetical protein
MKKNRQNGTDVLAGAIQEWRAGDGAKGVLSDKARGVIIETVHSELTPKQALVPLFVPFRRLVLAGVLPLLVVCAMAVSMLGPIENDSVSGLLVSKADGDVVFRIINGERSHAVYRSESPHALSQQAAQQVPDGIYRDSLKSDTNIVFYRID